MSRISDILRRLDESKPTVNGERLADQAIASAVTGKPKSDLIRNWRRAEEEGREASVNLESILGLASFLGVSPLWLETGEGPRHPITPAETELLEQFRGIPEEDRAHSVAIALSAVRIARNARRAAQPEETTDLPHTDPEQSS